MTGAMLFTMLLCFALTVSVAVSIGLAAIVGIQVSNVNMLISVKEMFASINKFPLAAIPFFILAGNLMETGGISRRLVEFAKSLVGGVQGGLPMTCVMTCMIFAAVSGSSVATTFAIGAILIPALIRHGYPTNYAAALQATSAELGVIIPPSIPMILFGIMTETSITQLFIAGVLPGLLLAALLALAAVWHARRFPRSRWDPREIVEALREGLLALALPVLLLGGIYSGYFTPTEAAAAALVYALLVETLVHRELDAKDFYRIVGETVVMLGMLLPLVAFATSLSVVLDYERIPQALVAWVQTWIDDRTSFLIAVNGLLLLAGAVMDVGSAIVILGPLLMPIARVYGVDPVHFGIIVTVNLEIGYITPPVGLNLFVAMAAFRASFSEVCRAALPFIGVMLVGLALISAWPALSLALVR